MNTNSTGIIRKCEQAYWESVGHAHKFKILKYPLLCLLTLLFGIAFAVQFCAHGILLLFNKMRNAVSHKNRTEQARESDVQAPVRRYRYAAVFAIILLLAAAIFVTIQKFTIPATECKPQSSSAANGTANGGTGGKASSQNQNAVSLPSQWKLEISNPTKGTDGTYQFSVTMNPDSAGTTASGSTSAKLSLPNTKSAEDPFCSISGLKIGENTVTVPSQALTNLLPASNPKRVIIVDTTSYVMAPGDVYGIKAQLIGQSKHALTAYSSDKQVAQLVKCSSTYYLVIGHKEGTCEIRFEADGMHASTKITVQANARAHGDAGRVLAAH